MAVPASMHARFFALSHSPGVANNVHDEELGFAALMIDKKEAIALAEDDLVANRIHKKSAVSAKHDSICVKNIFRSETDGSAGC